MDVQWKKRKRKVNKRKESEVRRLEEEFIKKHIDIFQIDWLEETRNVSLSVVIPCYYKHFYMLKNLIKIYRMQTILPDEIIVSISGINFMDRDERFKFDQFLEWVEKKNDSLEWRIPIEIVYHPGVMLPGANKNCAISRALGDVIVIQDCDDIPHIQRLEVIKFWFDHCDLVHLAHGLNKRTNPRMIVASEYEDLKFNQYRYTQLGRMNFYRRIEESYSEMPQSMRVYISNGEVAFLRSIVTSDRHEFDPTIDRAEDWRFNRLIEETYQKSINLQAPLMIYNKTEQIQMGSKKKIKEMNERKKQENQGNE